MNSERKTAALIALVLTVLTFAVFGQSATFEFINYDDPEYVYENPNVMGGLTADGVAWAFTHVHSANWHPLTWLSHMLDAELYGDWAGGHHLTNVVLHAGVVVVLFFALMRLTRRMWPSAFVAATFAIHPLRAESVAWVSERKDVLCALFFSLALFAYARYATSPYSTRRYLGVFLAMALGLLAKPMIVTLPVVLLLVDVWPLRRFAWTRGTDDEPPAREGPPHPVLEKLPLFGLSAASCAVTLLAQRGALASLEVTSYGLRLKNAIVAVAVYLKQFVVPTDLGVFYPLRSAISTSAVVVSAVTLVAITVLAIVQLRRRPYIAVGWAWFLVMLAPVVGLVQVGSQAHADRYTYLPQIGIALALCFGALELARSERARRLTPKMAATAGAVVIAVWASLAVVQVSHWKTSIRLWRHTAGLAADNALAWHLWAGGLVNEERHAEALPIYERAALLRPDHVNIQTALAATAKRLGRLDLALYAYRNLWRLNPDDLIATNNLAWFLATCPVDELRNGTEAVQLAEHAARLTAHENHLVLDTLAAAYAESGDLTTAQSWQRLALELAPEAERPPLAERLVLYGEGRVYHEEPAPAVP